MDLALKQNVLIAILVVMGCYIAVGCYVSSPATERIKVNTANWEAFGLDVSQGCHSETGPLSFEHKEALNLLDGKRVVFIGDSITRYQYLALAYYITHGRCPDLYASMHGYILAEWKYASWQEFFKNSSAALTVQAPPIYTREVCLCTRLALLPLQVSEHRHYVYEDIEGRRIELIYLQYFTEKFGTMRAVTDIMESLEPTDVLMNFGAWTYQLEEDCEEPTSADSLCPKISWVCKYIKANHNFRVWWLTSPPALSASAPETVEDIIPPGHRLHIPTRCKLDPSRVIDRTEALELLQPDATLRHKLFWNKLHMHAEANHGFNRMFLSRLAALEAQKDPEEQLESWRLQPQAQHPSNLWNKIFGSKR